MIRASKSRLTALVLIFASIAWGVRSQVTSEPVRPSHSDTLNLTGIDASQPAAQIRELISAGRLPGITWPDFSRNRAELDRFYQGLSYGLAWTRNSAATKQAATLMEILQGATTRGLDPADYDGAQWAERTLALRHAQPPDLIRFDLALTISVMRFVSDLHSGRVNPYVSDESSHEKQYGYVPTFLIQLVNAPDVNSALQTLEPAFPEYRRTIGALARYRSLARSKNVELLRLTQKTLDPGNNYAQLADLRSVLQRSGDLRIDAPIPPDEKYIGEMVEAVKRFQKRHGLEPDARIGRSTLDAMNTPMTHRITQLELSLERWRWLPHQFPRPPIIVNIPEFRLHAYDRDLRSAVSMKVVVGKAYKHQTPIFTGDMKYVIFRPPWNVPLSIQRAELIPKMKKNPHYLLEENFDIVDRYGNVVTEDSSDPRYLKYLSTGELGIRQKPGPKNSLGLVKFLFPNDHDVYLHGTPATALFSKARRDFSHGCIRVEDPVALAHWVLRDDEVWSVDNIVAAMNGARTSRVSVEPAVPVLIVYSTSTVGDDGDVEFFEDIYKRDAELQRAIAHRHDSTEYGAATN